jgi:hypothetical protein
MQKGDFHEEIALVFFVGCAAPTALRGHVAAIIKKPILCSIQLVIR